MKIAMAYSGLKELKTRWSDFSLKSLLYLIVIQLKLWVTGRGSETQNEVSENLNHLILRFYTKPSSDTEF